MDEGAEAITSSTGWIELDAKDWAEHNDRDADLHVPWRIAAEVVKADGLKPIRVLDAASGPGGFLASMLEAFPRAEGVWLDFSVTMEREAKRNLARYASRVSYFLGDLVNLSKVGAPGSFDLVTTSRATHHLAAANLGRFYANAISVLRPGGWIANVDSLNCEDAWNRRLSAVRDAMRTRSRPNSGSSHPRPERPPTENDHLTSIQAAGFEAELVVWRNLRQALIMARKPGDAVA